MSSVIPLLTDALWHGFVVFLRVAALTSLLPAFGEQSVPVRVKLGLALVFTVVVAPAVNPIPIPQGVGGLVIPILTETLAGLALGLAIRLFVMALQMAGSIAAQSTSLSQVLGGAATEPLPAIGYILVVAGLAFAVMTGLHVKAAEFMIRSYEMLPMARFPNASVISEWGVMQVANAFTLAFTLAAPFVILSVIYNLALGAINKAMPQLMVAFVGAPVITAGGLFLLFISAPLMLSIWIDSIDSFLAQPYGLNP